MAIGCPVGHLAPELVPLFLESGEMLRIYAEPGGHRNLDFSFRYVGLNHDFEPQ